MRPWIVVIAGANGAGKTTSALHLLPAHLRASHFVNADLIARGLSPLAPWAAELRAGRLLLERIRELAAARECFAFETTLASRSFLTFLRRQQECGYAVHVTYLWLTSPRVAIERVEARVLEGGHHVEPEVVKRRYWRGLHNFLHEYRRLADTWILGDNSGSSLRVIARGGSLWPIEVLAPAVLAAIERSTPLPPLRDRRLATSARRSSSTSSAAASRRRSPGRSAAGVARACRSGSGRMARW